MAPRTLTQLEAGKRVAAVSVAVSEAGASAFIFNMSVIRGAGTSGLTVIAR